MRKRNTIAPIITIILIAFTILAVIPAEAQDTEGGNEPVGDPNFPAPDFPVGVDWINVPAPLTFEQLRGKVVLLDFWTYGCINCIHMIPVVKQLEDKYGDALVVIGVHSAKFANEGQTENIRQIVQRYGLVHPVIADNEFAVWNTFAPFGVNAWPTFAVIDPRGNMYAVQAGEIPFEALDQVIGGMIGYFDGLGEISRDPIQLSPEGAASPNSALNYPGKVTVDTSGNRLFIADSSHNRLIIADLTSYEILDVIGTGEAGFADGAYSEATFNKPQGMALDGDTLYVADTDNHAIRAVNLLERSVTTFAGTGNQGYNRSSRGNRLTMDLSSPWDVWIDGNALYIAMAGTHQIWALIFDTDEVGPLVGSGAEGLIDTNFDNAQLAQPSGLYYKDGILYFTDPESSSIRAADIEGFSVTTLAGPMPFEDLQFSSADQGMGSAVDLGEITLPQGNYLMFLAAAETTTVSLTPINGECNYGAPRPGTSVPSDTQAYQITSESCTAQIALSGADQEWTLTIRDASSPLFQFGDIDGGLGIGRLQHALGVVGGDDGLLYIADTYNNKIKVLNPETKELTTLSGLGGTGGYRDGDAAEAAFDEPGGLAYADGKLYIADTNNQAIRVIDLSTKMVSTVQFPNPEALQIGDQITVVGGSRGTEIALDEQTVAAGTGEIVLNVTLPEGYKLNPNIPFLAQWSSSDSAIQIAEADQQQSLPAPEMPLRIPVTLSEGSAALTGSLTIYYCEAVQESLCFIDDVVITAPITVSGDGSGSAIQVERVIIPPTVNTNS